MMGGFNEGYRRRLSKSTPGTCEDIALGYRLKQYRRKPEVRMKRPVNNDLVLIIGVGFRKGENWALLNTLNGTHINADQDEKGELLSVSIANGNGRNGD